MGDIIDTNRLDKVVPSMGAHVAHILAGHALVSRVVRTYSGYQRELDDKVVPSMVVYGTLILAGLTRADRKEKRDLNKRGIKFGRKPAAMLAAERKRRLMATVMQIHATQILSLQSHFTYKFTYQATPDVSSAA